MHDLWLRWARRCVEAARARATGGEADDDAVHQATIDIHAAADGPCELLRDRLGLAAPELELLWLTMVATTDPMLAMRLRSLGGSSQGLDLATIATLAQWMPSTGAQLARRLGVLHPLVAEGILDVDGDGAAVARLLRPAPGVAAFLTGEPVVDEDLGAVGGAITAPPATRRSPDQQAALARLATALADPEPAVIVVVGPPLAGKRGAIAEAAATLGRTAVEVDLRRIEKGERPSRRALRALRRHRILGDCIGVVTGLAGLDANLDNDVRWHALLRFLDAAPATVVVTTSNPGLVLPVRRRVLRIAWPVPDAATRRQLWPDLLAAAAVDAEIAAGDLDELAYRHQLSAPGIADAVRTSRVIAAGAGRGTPGFDDVIGAIRAGTAERLHTLAFEVRTRQAWDDLVLPTDTLDQVRAFVSRVRNSMLVFDTWGLGRKVGNATGTAGLFSGPPGTGKTMVAGLIARELGLDLYQVDLSKVMSKWVGETEKQLASLFDAAAAGHVMLLFDEADALLTKRTADVKSATDRFANLEVNYLLQRIENFGGVIVLTTNLDTNLDDALRRRLAAHIPFWHPEEDERALLWTRFLASNAPTTADIDARSLAAEFSELAGGHIKNAVVAAAFAAAERRQPISQALLLAAARAEYQALGRVLTQRS